MDDALTHAYTPVIIIVDELVSDFSRWCVCPYIQEQSTPNSPGRITGMCQKTSCSVARSL